MRLDHRFVGWGVLFIVAGAVVLAVHEGLLDSSVVARWLDLWPLLLIALGVSIILSRTPAAWVGSLVAAIVVGAMAGGLLSTGAGTLPSLAGCGTGSSQALTPQSGTLAAAAQVNVEFDCGNLTVGTVEGSAWQLSGNDGRAPSVDASQTALAVKAATSGFGGRGKVAWTLNLPRAPLLDLGLTLNAGHGEVGLAGASLASLSATLNAGDLTVSLGPQPVSNVIDLTVNAGSASLLTQASAGTMNLSVNAGSLDVCAPSGSAIRVHWNGTLASQNLGGLGLVKVDSNTWTSNGFEAAAPHLELDVSANAGSFNLSLGGCGNA